MTGTTKLRRRVICIDYIERAMWFMALQTVFIDHCLQMRLMTFQTFFNDLVFLRVTVSTVQLSMFTREGIQFLTLVDMTGFTYGRRLRDICNAEV
jgi:hypothetical protein